ncbi:MAG TPA: helix-turn-helix domain-containing protein [Stellaceae bacterium]|nr:helix-turn-helix domain-containing protein [Stellaceae bacterium]
MADQLLTEKEAANITGFSVYWFQRKRWEGGGPPFVKFQRAVRYRESDLVAWIEAHSGKRSTSDYANSVGSPTKPSARGDAR